ncbi:ABC transporter permease [Bacteroidota bacterium]
MLFLRLLKESLFFAYHSIILNKLRTFLSLLGITIGIFAIISVFTVIDSLERNIRDSISSLGDNVIYIQKWPWQFGGEYKWWVYLKRPVPTIKEYDYLKRQSQRTEALCFSIATNTTIKYKNNSISNAAIIAATHDFQDLRAFEIEKGRYFSTFESNSGRNVCVIGNEIASKLFEGKSPLGKQIVVEGGHKLNIIGIFKKEGKDVMGGGTLDDVVLANINHARNIINIRSERLNPYIMVKAKPNVSIEELKAEIKGLLRAYRRIKPKQDDTFALNQASLLTQGFKQIFGVIDIAGWIIGGFSILVGGFGIANIMFVSVKERTNIIGIQKSLGAKNYFILFQFLFESVLLATLGGIIGLLLIFIASSLASNAIELNIYLSAGNITTGLIISIVIGIISGFSPAYSASRLNPVDAINTHF